MRPEEIQIITNVVKAMFPVSTETGTLVDVVSAYASGQTNKATARCNLRTALEIAGMNVDDDRLELCNDTAFQLVYGYRHWVTDQGNPDVLDIYPARELKQIYDRVETTNWIKRWTENGGILFQESRMIACVNDPIWQRISALHLPFPPFDLDSGMDFVIVDRTEAEELGLIEAGQTVRAVTFDLDFVNALQERANSYLSADGRLQRLAIATSNVSSVELLRMAEDRLEDLADSETQATAEIALLVDRALHQGFGDSLEKQGEAYGQLADIKEALEQADEANTFRLRQIEALEKWIVEGIPTDGNQRARVCEQVARLHEKIGNTERAVHCRQLQQDSRTPYSLFFEARSHVKAAGGMNVQLAPEIVKELNEALERGFGNNVFDEANALGLLVEAYDCLKQTNEANTFRLRQAESLRALIAKGVPIESDSRAKVYRQLVEIFQKLGDEDKAATFRQLEEESRDAFSLLNEVLDQIRKAGNQIEQEVGARMLDRLTKAAGKIPESYVETHAQIYRATGEILEALGDTAQAAEYYEYAIQKNPRVGVKQRLVTLKKKLKKLSSSKLEKLWATSNIAALRELMDN